MGKKTNELDTTLFHCWGNALSNRSFAIENIAIDFEHCKRSSKIVLKKLLPDQSEGKPIYEIVEEISVTNSCPKFCRSIVMLQPKNDPRETDYLIEYEDKGTKFITEVFLLGKWIILMENCSQ